MYNKISTPTKWFDIINIALSWNLFLYDNELQSLRLQLLGEIRGIGINGKSVY